MPEALRPVTLQFGICGTALSGLPSRMHCWMVMGGIAIPDISMREVSSQRPGCIAWADAEAAQATVMSRAAATPIMVFIARSFRYDSMSTRHGNDVSRLHGEIRWYA